MNMRRFISLLIVISFALQLCSCSKEEYKFVEKENGDLVRKDGEVYEFLAFEPSSPLGYIGTLEFEGSVKGEPKTSHHLLSEYQTGLFSIKESGSDNILIRKEPDNEWYSIYRKKSLPKVDFTVDNCDRLELVNSLDIFTDGAKHVSCGEGITDPEEIKEFIADVRAQEDADSAKLHDLVKQPDGTLKNCSLYASILGYFDDEPYLVYQMAITSYNDLAFSVTLEGKEYVFPEEWFEKLICQKYFEEVD